MATNYKGVDYMDNYTLDGEIWKDVQEFKGILQVSNKGRVRTLDRVCKAKNGGTQISKGMLRKATKDKQGYLKVVLTVNGSIYARRVHRLVATEFISNPMNKPEVNHIDGVKDNNEVNNLEWVTAKENVRHAHANNLIKPFKRRKLKGHDNPSSRFTESQIEEVKRMRFNGSVYREIAEKFDVSIPTIRNICKGISYQ